MTSAAVVGSVMINNLQSVCLFTQTPTSSFISLFFFFLFDVRKMFLDSSLQTLCLELSFICHARMTEHGTLLPS